MGVFLPGHDVLRLSRVKPELKGGIYSYASAGFGDFLGFNSAWGYWISALLCTVSFSALLFGALAYFFPVFGEGNNLASVVGASALVWFYAFLVSRGIKEVTGVNAVITISKIVPSSWPSRPSSYCRSSIRPSSWRTSRPVPTPPCRSGNRSAAP